VVLTPRGTAADGSIINGIASDNGSAGQHPALSRSGSTPVPAAVSTTTVPLPSPREHEVMIQSSLGDRLQRPRGVLGSSRRCFALEPDPSICRSLGTTSGKVISIAQADARNDVLRRHFYDLTLAFFAPVLVPLECWRQGQRRKKGGRRRID
jgi:hypothetical protein